MYALIAGAIFVISLGALAWQVLSRMRVPAAISPNALPSISAERYRPMLRLLGDEDLHFVSANSTLQRTLRARRRKLFRSYLRCLARDYSVLLAGVRAVIVQAGVDRPDLVRALTKNRILFAITMGKVEFRLALHAIGIGKVDISGLVDTLEALHAQVSILSAAPAAA